MFFVVCSAWRRERVQEKERERVQRKEKVEVGKTFFTLFYSSTHLSCAGRENAHPRSSQESKETAHGTLRTGRPKSIDRSSLPSTSSV